jgi:RNA exonuclease 1
MMHPYVIDTSVIYNITGNRFRKAKLALLAKTFLGEIIQQDKQGHCSVEDSLACIKLTQLKLANGMLVGQSVWLSFIEYMIWVVFNNVSLNWYGVRT